VASGGTEGDEKGGVTLSRGGQWERQRDARKTRRRWSGLEADQYDRCVQYKISCKSVPGGRPGTPDTGGGKGGSSGKAPRRWQLESLHRQGEELVPGELYMVCFGGTREY
jgi:hypothetical protein